MTDDAQREAAEAASRRGEQLLHRWAKPFGYAGALVLCFMMLYTTYAVVMRQFFDLPVFGVVDVMELSLLFCIFLALPGIFLRDENITVDIIDRLVPPRVLLILRFIGLFLTLLIVSVALSGMFGPAQEKLTSGETTMALGMSRFYHWIPILFGFSFASLGTLAVIIVYLKMGVPHGSARDDEPDAVHPTETGA